MPATSRSGESGRAARRAAWPARPRSRGSSSPSPCAGSGRGGGRRGCAARHRLVVAAERVERRAQGLGVRRESGTTSAARRQARAHRGRRAGEPRRRPRSRSGTARRARRAPRRWPRRAGAPRRRSRRRPRRRAGPPRRTGRARWPGPAPSRRWPCAGTAAASPAASGSPGGVGRTQASSQPYSAATCSLPASVQRRVHLDVGVAPGR